VKRGVKGREGRAVVEMRAGEAETFGPLGLLRRRLSWDRGLMANSREEEKTREDNNTTQHNNMPLHPRYAVSHCLSGAPLASSNTVEVFLDFNCPFSAKMFRKLQDEVVPAIREDRESHNQSSKDASFNLWMVNVVQPWHGVQSSILHDVSFAVARSAPSKYGAVARVLFDNIERFYDSEVQDLTRRQITQSILELISEKLTLEEKRSVEALLYIAPDSGNAGNGVGVDNKYFAKYARTLGVHVTPTVVVNGIVVPSIESSTESENIVSILKDVTN
jgi:hypothetical protein